MRPDPYALTSISRHINPLITPRANLNGNSKQSLVDMLLAVKHALEDADMAFVQASDCVHGRNFQSFGDRAMSMRGDAEDAWRERRLILQAMAAEIYALAIDISNQ
jgi:hypothetical protein